MAAYDRALALAPGADDPAVDGIRLLRANALVRAGRPEEAVTPAEQLAGRHPGDPDVSLALGLAQQAARAPGAAASLTRFLEPAPDSPAAPGGAVAAGGRVRRAGAALLLADAGRAAHDVVLVQGDRELGRSDVLAPGERQTVSVEVAPGQPVRPVCRLTGHPQAGMHAGLTVAGG
ncbi:tetratricopeptide repeat protein [Geodermatophilus sp. SYSU D00758]